MLLEVKKFLMRKDACVGGWLEGLAKVVIGSEVICFVNDSCEEKDSKEHESQEEASLRDCKESLFGDTDESTKEFNHL